MGYCSKHDAYNGNGRCPYCHGEEDPLAKTMAEDMIDKLQAVIQQKDKEIAELHRTIMAIHNEYRSDVQEVHRLRGKIPAYEPPPCECCRQFTDYYAAECDCGNLGDHEAAVRWCTRMEIADSFEEQE